MVTRSTTAPGVSLLLALASFVLAFSLLVDLGFMVGYFASDGGPAWRGPKWRRFLGDFIQAGPLILLGGWAGLAAGAGFLGSQLAAEGRRTRAAITPASLASLLSACGLMGAGLAALTLALLVICRLIGSS